MSLVSIVGAVMVNVTIFVCVWAVPVELTPLLTVVVELFACTASPILNCLPVAEVILAFTAFVKAVVNEPTILPSAFCVKPGGKPQYDTSN